MDHEDKHYLGPLCMNPPQGIVKDSANLSSSAARSRKNHNEAIGEERGASENGWMMFGIILASSLHEAFPVPLAP